MTSAMIGMPRHHRFWLDALIARPGHAMLDAGIVIMVRRPRTATPARLAEPADSALQHGPA